MPEYNFCFCGLALGHKYRICAVDLAKDLDNFHPGVKYLILTDAPEDFRDLSNVIPLKHQQDSLMFPYHDRRFAFAETLARFDVALQIDTDVRLLKPLIFPDELRDLKGIFGNITGVSEHLGRYQPANLPLYKKVSRKMNVDFETAPHVGEFIFAVGRDNGREKDFIAHWGTMGRYLELNKIHGADGPVIGLASVKAGLPVIHSSWPGIVEREFVEHLKFSSGKNKVKKSRLELLKFRFNYHYRLNKARLFALKDYEFFYT